MYKSKLYQLIVRTSVLVIALQLMLQCIYFPSDNRADAESLDFGNAYVKAVEVGTKRYAVGFMSYEIWTNSAGVWTTKSPGDTVNDSELTYPYSFSFPGRKVKDVKVYNFDTSNTTHINFFGQSRSTDDYIQYRPYFSIVNGNPITTEVNGKNTSNISFTVGLPATLDSKSGRFKNVIDEMKAKDPSVTFAPGVEARRYYYPVVFEIELYGQTEMNYFATDGTRIAPTEYVDMSIGDSYPKAPISISGYTYANKYKYTKNGSDPSSASFTTGTPSLTYDGTFDKYRVNYYYDVKSTDGAASIYHVDENGKSLSYVFKDHTDVLKKSVDYTPKAPTSSAYEYLGYIKTTKDDETIINFSNPIPGEYNIKPYAGGYNVKLYYVYKLIDVNQSAVVHVRHMVRKDSSSPYVVMNETEEYVMDLPKDINKTANPALYGKYIGKSFDGSKYNDTPLTGALNQASQSVTMHLQSPNAMSAYISFFYEASTPKSFTGDFDVINPTIAYKDSFTLKPKNFVMSGCTYLGHQYMIVRDGRTYISDFVSSQTASTTYSYSNYPHVIGIGAHQISIKIFTSNCGESDWINPKTLTVTGPATNHPPTFKGGFTAVGDSTNKIITQVVEGSYVDLKVWGFLDEDGDDIYFDGFDFDNGTKWVRNIPNGRLNIEWLYGNLKADVLGSHVVKAYVHDQFGATASVTIYINVVPRNPIPVITGPTKVVEGRPVKPALSSDASFSYVGHKIDHSKDEWTNRKDVYDTVRTETITLDVTDDQGLRSLAPAVYKLEVIPDLPPIPDLQYNTPTVRNVEAQFKDTSYSPDGDKIVEHKVRLRYDADNDGSFSDETFVDISLSAVSTFSRKFAAVGKYQFEIYLKEDWGRSATKTFDFEVVNDAPTVSFDITSESQKPIVIPTVSVAASTMVNSTDWHNSNISNETVPKAWGVNSRTGVLSHSPLYAESDYSNYQSFILRHSTVYRVPESGYSLISKVTTAESRYSSCSEYYCSFGKDGATYLKNGYYVYHNYNYRYSPYEYTAVIANNAGDQFERTGEGFSGTLATGDVLGGDEFVLFVDYANEFVWTRVSTWNQSTYATKNYILKYRMDDFINPSGKAIGVYANSPYDFDRGKLSNSTEYFAYDGRNVNYYSWNNPSVIQRTEAMATDELMITGKPDAKMEYFGDQDGYPYQDYIFNSNTRAATKVKIADSYGNQTANYISPNGKYLFTIGKIIERDTEKVVVDLAATGGVNASWYYNIMFNGGDTWVSCNNNQLDCKLYKWNWRTDGTFTLIKALPSNIPFYILNSSVYSPRDSKGFLYYVTAYGIERFDTSNGDTKLIVSYDFDAETLRNDNTYDRTSYWYVTVVGDGLIRVVRYGWESPKATSGSTYYTYLNYMFKSNDFKDATRADVQEQQLLGKAQLSNAQFNYSVRINSDYTSKYSYVGFSFNAQDNRNMYRVESNANTIRLVRVDGGVRTVLVSKDYNFASKTIYDFKIKVLDSKITVYVGGAPLLEATDKTFGKGSFGPYSQIQKTEFLRVSYSDLDVLSSVNKLQGIALVDTKMTYAINNDDTENDVMAKELTSWKYEQVSQKFLDAGDGKSGVSIHNGKSYTTQLETLDKVGLYDVSYETVDDPNSSYLYPSNVFDDYRKKSNKAVRSLIVHRAPIVDYDVALNPDKTVKWTDRSYDPDRYLGATNYSTENTGIDYKATRGISEKSFYYITPSGQTVFEKLVVAPELGTYTVGLAVKDEYNAWSTILEKTIVVDVLPSPNDPPVPGFTLSAKETYRNTPVTINSIAYDKEDGDRTHLSHAYYISNDASAGLETLQSTVRTSWTKTFSTIGVQRIRQTVEDSLGQTTTFTDYVNVINRIPKVAITVPASADQNNPTKFTEAQPTIKFTYNDGDGDAQTKYQVKIYRYGGVLEYESGIKSSTATSWTIDTVLAEKTYYYVIARVFDGYDWSEWSAARFFYIETNRPPVAQFDWTPKPVWEGDKLQLIDQSSDPDRDKLTSLWAIKTPSGSVQNYTEVPSLSRAEPGTYTVTLEVSDGKLSAQAISNVVVLPLSIEADVRHTEEWKKVHDREGHETNTNPKDFYAGEIMIANARPTAGAQVKKVTVKFVATGLDGKDLTREWEMSAVGGNGLYAAELFDAKWASLQEGVPQGLYRLKFTVIYSNGTIKSTEVPFQIIGSVYKAVGVHRRQ
ncbi:hypothetical protein PCCS19_51860 [Paenibacillus sp. CCS19]|uniref:glycoside hydrolase family 78 protein n=1 Tax=Paenibacillus sp. CCS19 TaxID=3158387 RepID=UPI00255FEB0A|nr:hypothetical protein [Paenibacillus cellulosilyticus]GMK42127.1 hypothetical protein PCCS19_51860 [Paenibacillus cellulosilyticus]